jgi:hypothetical protein
MSSPERNRHVRLFVRDDLPRPARRRRRAVVDRVCDIGERTAVDVSVDRWPKRFERGGDDDLRETHASFVEWARVDGTRLTPFFSVRECYSMATGEKGEWIVLPVVCLAVYEDDELVSVYPHCDGEEKRSVEDGLDALVREAEPDADRLVVAG